MAFSRLICIAFHDFLKLLFNSVGISLRSEYSWLLVHVWEDFGWAKPTSLKDM